VTLTVEVAVGSSWGKDCTIEQVYDQAAREAIGRLNSMATKYGPHHGMKIIGEPKVDAVLSTREP